MRQQKMGRLHTGCTPDPHRWNAAAESGHFVALRSDVPGGKSGPDC
jgi:hypothetical protein